VDELTSKTRPKFNCESQNGSYSSDMKNYIKVLLASTLLIGCAPQSVGDAAASPEKADAESVVSIYDQLAPPVSERMQRPSMLLFSKTRAWRHEAGIAGANMHMIKLSRKMEYGTFSTENGAIFNDEDLAKFEIVVMNNFTGDGLSPAQEAALQRWLEAGGGLLALHGAGDASHSDWPWYDVDVMNGIVLIAFLMRISLFLQDSMRALTAL